MNNLISFWLAPLTALFHPAVYRDAVRSSAGRGVLYALYAAAISTAVILGIMFAVLLPQADAVAEWAQKNLPVLIWTPDGLSVEGGQSAKVMDYPGYGPVIIFDMSKTAVTGQDMGSAFLFVTATKVYIQREPGRLEVRDITKTGIQTQQQLPEKVRITGEVVGKLYQNVKKTLKLLVPGMVLFGVFVFNLLGIVFYSLVGFLLNQTRKSKLPYGAIFSLTSFALTASWLLTWIRLFPPFQGFPWPWWGGVLVNLAYLFFAFRVTDQAPEGEATS